MYHTSTDVVDCSHDFDFALVLQLLEDRTALAYLADGLYDVLGNYGIKKALVAILAFALVLGGFDRGLDVPRGLPKQR